MPAAVAIPAALGVAGIAGNMMGADAGAKAAEDTANKNVAMSREQIAENKRQFDLGLTEQQKQSEIRKKAYEQAVATGSAQMAQGEQGFMGSINEANPELDTMSNDIANGNARALSQGAGQMSANLATQGVRGGQAATLLNRGTGSQAISAQENINQLKYQDAATRAAQLRAYQAAKSQAGQSASLSVGA